VIPEYKKEGSPIQLKPKIAEIPQLKPKKKSKLRGFLDYLDFLMTGNLHIKQPQNTASLDNGALAETLAEQAKNDRENEEEDLNAISEEWL